MNKVLLDGYIYITSNQFYDCFEKNGNKYFGYKVIELNEYRLFSTTHKYFGIKIYK